MKIAHSFREKFPKLSKWVEQNLPKAKNKQKVWAAFLKYSELGDSEASYAVGTGPLPILHSAIMPNANGEFRGSTEPNHIYLAEEICERFEKSDSGKPEMHLLLESTILHETVHWGDWKDGIDQAGEEGKKFEKEAYGKDINRYW